MHAKYEIKSILQNWVPNALMGGVNVIWLDLHCTNDKCTCSMEFM